MALSLALLAVVAAAFLSLVSARWVPNETLHITRANLTSDCTTRLSTIINGTSPGPVLRFKEGEHVWIRVYNDMDVNTTLHFHGLSQYGSPFADGTPQTSQWPIAPRSFFDYEFVLGRGSAGTYMYHTHVEFQIASAYGAFIVEDPSPPTQYEKDIHLLFGDFYHADNDALMQSLLGNPFKWIGEPQSMTVNGNALGVCNSSISVCSTTCHHHVVEVEPDTVYRVRAIGITSLTFPWIAIEGHSNLTFFEADAAYIKPVESSRLQLHSGQRFSFLLRTKTEAELAKLGTRNFWGRIESRWRPTRDPGAFILSYKCKDKSAHESVKTLSTTPAPANLNVTIPLPSEGEPWIDHQLEPLEKVKYDDSLPDAKSVTRTITLSAHQLVARNGRWFVDGLSYNETSPHVPYLVSAYKDKSRLSPNYELAAANDGFDPSTGTYPIRMGETVEIVFQNNISDNGFAEAHPWHLHGQHPWLIESGVISNDSQVTTVTYTPAKPVRRDTIITYAGQGASYAGVKSVNGTFTGYTKMRMTATTPGAWLVHCHIQPHAVLGMAVVFLVAPEELPPLPKDFKAEYLTYDPVQDENNPPKSYFNLTPAPV